MYVFFLEDLTAPLSENCIKMQLEILFQMLSKKTKKNLPKRCKGGADPRIRGMSLVHSQAPETVVAEETAQFSRVHSGWQLHDPVRKVGCSHYVLRAGRGAIGQPRLNDRCGTRRWISVEH